MEATDPESTNTPAMLEFGRRLRRLREASRLSVNALARRAGVDRGYLSRLENGQVKRPSHEILGRLARPLRLTTAQLTGEDTPDGSSAGAAPPERWREWVATLRDIPLDELLAILAALSPEGRAECLDYARWRLHREMTGGQARAWVLMESAPRGDPRILGEQDTRPDGQRQAG